MKIVILSALFALTSISVSAKVNCSGEGHNVIIATSNFVDSVLMDGRSFGPCQRHTSDLMLTIKCGQRGADSLLLILNAENNRIKEVALSYMVGNSSYPGTDDTSGYKLICD